LNCGSFAGCRASISRNSLYGNFQQQSVGPK
jgi:hypothetical protein